MRVVRLLSLRRLRLQPVRAVLAAVVVGAGVSLVVAIVVIISSLNSSVQSAGRALAGPAPLRVVGALQRGGISPAAVRDIDSTPGVRAAIPIVQGLSTIDEGRGGPEVSATILGFDCRIEALFGAFSCDPRQLAALSTTFVSTSLGKDLGPAAAARTDLGRVPLAGAVPVAALNGLNGGRVVAFALPEARRQLTRGTGVDIVYVLPEHGTSVDTLQSRLVQVLGPDVAVLAATDPPPVIGIILSTFIPLFTIIALLTLGIGAVLVRNSVSLSMEERRRQTAIVGALGGSSRVLVWGTLAEAGVLGLVGGALGIAGGLAVSVPVSASIGHTMRQVAGIPLDIGLRTPAVVVAIGVGVVVSLLAALGPARRATRVDVAAELAGRGRRDEVERAGSWPRIAVAFVASLVGLALCALAQRQGGIEPWQARLAPLAFLLSVVPAVYFTAMLVPRILAFTEGRLRFRRASSRLAFANVRREPRRTAVMAVALGFAMAVGFATASFKASVSAAITESLNGHMTGVEVSSIDPQNAVLSEARLSPAVLRGLAAVPGVDRVERSAFVMVGNRAGHLIGVSAFTDPWLNDKVAAGAETQLGLAAGQVAIGPALARSDRIKPGDHLTLSTSSGRVSLPVMSVVYNGNFGGNNVLMDYDLATRLYGDQPPVTVVAQPKPGVSVVELAAAIRRAHLDPALQVHTPDEVLARNIKQVSDQLSSFDALQRGLLAMSFIAVLSTLLLVGVQRQREFGMLGAVGMTPQELGRMILVEAGAVALAGVAVGAVASLQQYAALHLITPVIIGYRDPFRLALVAGVVYGAISVVVALVAGLYPSRRAGKVDILEALRYE